MGNPPDPPMLTFQQFMAYHTKVQEPPPNMIDWDLIPEIRDAKIAAGELTWEQVHDQQANAGRRYWEWKWRVSHCEYCGRPKDKMYICAGCGAPL